jgi:hypothetical protein
MTRPIFVALAFLPQLAIAADFTVGPNAPFTTLFAARDAARQAGPGPHRIIVQPGEYYLDKPLDLDARDNGLTLEAAEPGKSTLYGGRLVTGWRPDGDKFWSADLPEVKAGAWDFRALNPRPEPSASKSTSCSTPAKA